MMRISESYSSLFLCLGLLGCSAASQPAEAVKPDAPTANEALEEKSTGPTCGNVNKTVEPLVVDWKSGTRTDLEVAMQKGVVVMAYGCDGMKVLESCSLEGSYQFAGVTPKEDMIQIENKAELWANLPLSVGNLEGELQGSATIDLAIALVGRRGSLRTHAAKPELKGECGGATHFVRAAHIGAFAMARGERGKVRAAAELFSVGAGGESETKRSMQNKDGDLQDCRTAKPGASEPPGKCAATVRLMLEPILAEPDPSWANGAPALPTKVENPCPEGWSLTEGKCAPSVQAGAPQLCDEKDEAGCKAQCANGSVESCFRSARFAKTDEERIALYQKACDAGFAPACSRLGFSKLSSDQAGGLALLEKACALGDDYTCWNTGRWYIEGRAVPKDEAKGALMTERGCSLGSPHACASYGSLLIAGVGVKADVERGLAMYQKLCDNGQSYYCHQLGSMYATDRKALADMRLPAPKEVKRDIPKGVRVWEQGCSLGSLWSCTLAADHYRDADGVKKDLTRAKQLYERACDGDKGVQRDACTALGTLYEKGVGGPKDLSKAADYYEKGCPGEQCQRLASNLAAGKEGFAKDEARALKLYEAACRKGAWGGREAPMCFDYGAYLEKADKQKAKDLYLDHCLRMGTAWVGGKKVSAAETRGGHAVLAQSCERLSKLDPANFTSVLKQGCMDTGVLCKELEKRDKKVALEAYKEKCESKKLNCKDVERLK
ncbi:MAG: sel1 repeat family protein [Polyangiaceae bacterium]|nr:sel1 repeat family protein [Polyangiaceae bacterium]MCB9607149.1 sel1 repeat family protein [Polyangiaceae bacterium]